MYISSKYIAFIIFTTAKLDAKLISLYAPLRGVEIPILVSVKLIKWSRYIGHKTSADCETKERERERYLYRLILIEKHRVSLKAQHGKQTQMHVEITLISRRISELWKNSLTARDPALPLFHVSNKLWLHFTNVIIKYAIIITYNF